MTSFLWPLKVKNYLHPHWYPNPIKLRNLGEKEREWEIGSGRGGNRKRKRSEDSKINYWRDLLDDLKQWWDNRDSKHMDRCGPLSLCDCVIRLILLFTGESKESLFQTWGWSAFTLLLTDAPSWVLSKLDRVEFDV